MPLSKSDVEDGKVNIEKPKILLQNVNDDGIFKNSSEKLQSDLDDSIFKNCREKLQSDLDDSISKDDYMTSEKFLNRNKEPIPQESKFKTNSYTEQITAMFFIHSHKALVAILFGYSADERFGNVFSGNAK
ncbi:hypothetical protein GQX74_005716 [Glossina fuscipes]|nr:hypothetical protein GQX74_005716 [Glossina fuscipes]